MFGKQSYLSPKGTPSIKYPVHRVGYEESMKHYLNPQKSNTNNETDMSLPEEKKTRIQLIGLPSDLVKGSSLLKKKLDSLLSSATLAKFGTLSAR
jgi:hypothetical protein